jgi:uncharacterized protein (TIGR02246 family)
MSFRSLFARILIPAILLTVQLLLIGCGKRADDTTAADIEAINRLHQREIEASKAWDIETLASLWTDDIVALPPDGTEVVGKDANRKAVLDMQQQNRDLQITDYILSFKEVKVVGDWAFEWGSYAGAARPSPRGQQDWSGGKIMRVLRRDKDGTWRIARTMYNQNVADQLGTLGN